jgi:DnaK suppressor protein
VAVGNHHISEGRPAMHNTTSASARLLREAQARHQALQAMLHDRQREMHALLRHRLLRAPAEGPDDGLDDSEHAEADIQEHIAVALIQMKGDTLQRLREALVRLETGEYGDCADCGCEISEQRLRALPFALRCTRCEAAHEQIAARDRGIGSRLSSPLLFAP